MNNSHRRFTTLSIVLFSIGIATGMFFYGFSFWADFEASLFDAGLEGDAGLSNLHCPLFLGKNETGEIYLKIKNPLARAIAPRIRAHISDGFVSMMREINSQPSLSQGESQTLEWDITSNDAVWNRFILVRVYQFPVYPEPSRSATCGIVLASLPLPGVLITGLLVAVSLLGMGSGVWLYRYTNRPLKDRQRSTMIAMTILGTTVTIGIVAALLGQLLVTMLLTIISVLLVVVLLGYFLNR